MNNIKPSHFQASGLTRESVEPERYFRLIAEVIKSGLRDEGPDYLRTRGGRYWCDVGNLNPDAVWRTAVKPGPRALESYQKAGAVRDIGLACSGNF